VRLHLEGRGGKGRVNVGGQQLDKDQHVSDLLFHAA
jgi:hypothetical protein